MKKSILFLIMLPTIANCATMCVNNDAVMVVLDPHQETAGTINTPEQQTAYSTTDGTKEWNITLQSGTISGIAACSKRDDYANDSNHGQIAASNYQTTLNPANYVGDFAIGSCYCKMLKPVKSLWVYSGLGDGGMGLGGVYGRNCTGGCARACAVLLAGIGTNNDALRKGMFGSIGQ